MLTALRLRRNLDMPGMQQDHFGRQKRKLIDFQIATESFKKWPTTGPIPYMFDGTHSEYMNTYFCIILFTQGAKVTKFEILREPWIPSRSDFWGLILVELIVFCGLPNFNIRAGRTEANQCTFHNAKLTKVHWSVTRYSFLRHLVGST